MSELERGAYERLRLDAHEAARLGVERLEVHVGDLLELLGELARCRAADRREQLKVHHSYAAMLARAGVNRVTLEAGYLTAHRASTSVVRWPMSPPAYFGEQLLEALDRLERSTASDPPPR